MLPRCVYHFNHSENLWTYVPYRYGTINTGTVPYHNIIFYGFGLTMRFLNKSDPHRFHTENNVLTDRRNHTEITVCMYIILRDTKIMLIMTTYRTYSAVV